MSFPVTSTLNNCDASSYMGFVRLRQTSLGILSKGVIFIAEAVSDIATVHHMPAMIHHTVFNQKQYALYHKFLTLTTPGLVAEKEF